MSKSLFVFCFVLFMVFPLYASGFLMEADAYGAYNASFPGFFSQAGFGGDVNPVGVDFSGFGLSAGCSVYHQTRSNVKGSVVSSSYYALGPDLKLSYTFASDFALWLRCRAMTGFYRPFDSRFFYIDVETGVSYVFLRKGSLLLMLTAPLCVAFRKDSTDVRAGVGLCTRLW